MSFFRLNINPEGLQDMLKALEHIKDGANTAMSRAMNRTVQNMRTEGVRVVRSELPLKAGEIRGTMGIKKAHKNSLEAWLSSRGPRLPLIRFQPRPADDRRPGPSVGVSVLKKKSEGRKKIPGSFVADMSSGHRGIYKRTSQSRFPIRELYGPAIPDILIEEPHNTDLERKADRKLNERLRHEVEFLLSKAAK